MSANHESEILCVTNILTTVSKSIDIEALYIAIIYKHIVIVVSHND